MNCVVCGKHTTLEVYDKSTGKTELVCLEHSGRVFEFGSDYLKELESRFRDAVLMMSTGELKEHAFSANLMALGAYVSDRS